MVEAIIYRYQCGIAWRDLPEVFGPWQTVWTWHHRMATAGAWDTVQAKLTTAAGVTGWSLSVDSTIARGLVTGPQLPRRRRPQHCHRLDPSFVRHT